MSLVLRGNKQTNKNVSLERRWGRGRRSLERGGGEKPGNIGVGGGAGLNGYAFPVMVPTGVCPLLPKAVKLDQVVLGGL